MTPVFQLVAGASLNNFLMQCFILIVGRIVFITSIKCVKLIDVVYLNFLIVFLLIT